MLAFKRRVRKGLTLTASVILMLSLTGCLYPKDQLKQNQAAPKEAVRNVQAAIEQYQNDTGLLPIHNSNTEVPIYEKYKIDFSKLQVKGYISTIPTAAFENGGNYYFIVIDEETEPLVKLLDIVTFQRVNDIQNWVRSHMQSGGELPKDEEMYPGFYQIDFKSMNRTAPDIRSVFSGQTIAPIIDDEGVVYTDYGIDLMQLILKSEGIAEDDQLDLRRLLVDSSDYVPVKSPIYRLVNGEPQAVHP